jgi:hypothetical protein
VKGSATVKVDGTINTKVEGLDNINTDLTVTIAPLKADLALAPLKADLALAPLTATVATESKASLALGEVKTHSKLDVEPLVTDSCITLRLAPLPTTRICAPYQHRVGFTVLGFELFGLSLRGEMKLQAGLKPEIVGDTQHNHARQTPSTQVVEGAGQGLRIRLG